MRQMSNLDCPLHLRCPFRLAGLHLSLSDSPGTSSCLSFEWIVSLHRDQCAHRELGAVGAGEAPRVLPNQAVVDVQHDVVIGVQVEGVARL